MAQFANMFEVNLDSRSYPVSLVQTVSEGNVYSNRIGAYVYKDGAPVNLGGACTGLVMRADGTTVPLTGYVEGNAAYVVLDQPSCAIPGPIQVAVNSVVGENITTLLVAYGTAILTDTRNYVEPGTPIPDITALLAEIDNMREATAAAVAAAADAEEAATKSVRYDTAQSLTDAQKAQARTNINAASGDIESRFISDGSVFNMIEAVHSGGYIGSNGDVVQYNNYSYTDFIEISPNVSYTFLAGAITSPYEYYITYAASYDANKNKIEYVNAASIENKVFSGAKYVRISWYSANSNVALFGKSANVNPYISSFEIVPYKETLAPIVDLSTNETPVTSWWRNSRLFTRDVVKAINRIGNIGGAPENSIAGFINAVNAGFQILLVDLLWTSDGVPVCCHDNDISRVAKTTSGGSVSGVLISQTTYSDLYNNYDFGIVNGEKYRGTKILSFNEFLRFAKYVGVDVYVEFKDFSSADYSLTNTVKMAYAMGIGDRISWHAGYAACNIIHQAYPDARLAYYMASGAASDTEINKAITLKGSNEVFLFGWDTTTFTEAQIDTLITNGIAYECGTLDTVGDIVSYMGNNPYCRGIESNSIVASQALIGQYVYY